MRTASLPPSINRSVKDSLAPSPENKEGGSPTDKNGAQCVMDVKGPSRAKGCHLCPLMLANLQGLSLALLVQLHW